MRHVPVLKQKMKGIQIMKRLEGAPKYFGRIDITVSSPSSSFSKPVICDFSYKW